MGHGSWPPEQSAPSSSELSPRRLAQLAAEVDLQLAPQQCERLLEFARLLKRWNRVYNLTAIEDGQAVLTRHLLDCLAIVRPLERAWKTHGLVHPDEEGLRFLDAGSGAGLPGIPLAICRPDWRGALVDAVQKKCAFLQQSRIELHLANVTVHHARLESLVLSPQDLIVSRAFASLREFVTRTRGLLAPHGLWAAMKGRNPLAQAENLPEGVHVLETITLRVPKLREQRHLVILGQSLPPAQRTKARTS